MKQWLLLALAVLLAAAFGWMPFQGTDVADLLPVEIVRIRVDDGTIRVQTDTGNSGSGTDLQEAFHDLKSTAAGEIFLETADYLLVDEGTAAYLEALCEYLRPGCGVCLESGEQELAEAAAFLKTHEPPVSLQDYRAGERRLPWLRSVEGRMYLVP